MLSAIVASNDEVEERCADDGDAVVGNNIVVESDEGTRVDITPEAELTKAGLTGVVNDNDEVKGGIVDETAVLENMAGSGVEESRRFLELDVDMAFSRSLSLLLASWSLWL